MSANRSRAGASPTGADSGRFLPKGEAMDDLQTIRRLWTDDGRLMEPRRGQRRSIRFWVYVHGPVKVTVSTDRPHLSHRYHEPTEEGYHYEVNDWLLDPLGRAWVECYHESGGRDCDGVVEHYTDRVLRAANVRAHVLPDCAEPRLDDPEWPEYEPGAKTRVYDQYAVMAGY